MTLNETNTVKGLLKNRKITNFTFPFLGAGCALTGQQTEVIITHYFRDKLTMTQRLIRMAPSVGNCLIPILVGYLSTIYTGDKVVMIYGAIIMQNCFFLASYTRPVYIEKVLRSTYNKLRDAVEDEDEVIFSNGTLNDTQERKTSNNPEAPNMTQDEEGDVVVYKSKNNAREVIDPSIQYRDNPSRSHNNEERFSSDFSTMYDNIDNPSSHRFSSDFGRLDMTSYRGIGGYQELESIDRGGHPQPLYRETTVDAPQGNLVFSAEMTPGTARRTASLKKNFITVISMLLDLNFYLYALLHLSTTFSVLILGMLFPPLVWVQNPSMNIWTVSYFFR